MEIGIMLVVGLISILLIVLKGEDGPRCPVCGAQYESSSMYCWSCHNPRIPGLPKR